MCGMFLFFFFFNDTATTEIYTLSLHDALPISLSAGSMAAPGLGSQSPRGWSKRWGDRKSTRLNSSHSQISYAVFCLKKKKQRKSHHRSRGSGACRDHNRTQREHTRQRGTTVCH